MNNSYFETTNARYPVIYRSVAEIIDLLPSLHDVDKVKSYATAMKQGALFPPIAVVKWGRYLWIADGHKRFQAANSLGVSNIAVEVWPWRVWMHDQASQCKRSLMRKWRLIQSLFKDPEYAVALIKKSTRHQKRLVASAGILFLRLTGFSERR